MGSEISKLDNPKPQNQFSTEAESLSEQRGSDKNLMEPETKVYIVKPKERNYFLKPTMGVIPKEAKVNTQKIQDIEPQTKGMKERNMEKCPSSFASKKKPFAKFSNLESESEEYWRGPTGHPFFDALFVAYSIHGEVALSPDDVWIQIASEFSKYIDINAKELRNKILTFEGKKDLIGN